MFSAPELRLRLANERIARDQRAARADRLAARFRLAEEARRRSRPSLRRSVGRSMISIGRRLAAEQPARPVRSR